MVEKGVKIDDKNPIPYMNVLLIGFHPDNNEEVRVIGYRRRGEKSFITQPKGFGCQFTHYINL